MRSIEEIKAAVNFVERLCGSGKHERLKQLNNELLQAMTEDIPLDRLEEICQAEREGRLVVLPCKVGDTVWINFTPKHPANPEHKGKWFTGEAEIERVKLGVKGLSFQTYIKSFTPTDIGKTVFLTGEEAEAALERSKA